ncbi:MAG: glutamine synthetase [Planctomycetes bacterium]|nr:glutamine synthetase [Planctomycetota bacterium]
MTTPTGMLSLDQLSTAVEGGQIDTVLVGFTDLYGRLMGKRFDGRFFLQTVADAGTHACNYLLTVDMEMEPVAGYELANWEKGYGDFHLAPDFDTLRIASWLDRTAMVLADVHDPATHVPVEQAPRSMLRRQIERATGAGFTVMAASEIEYYLFRDSFREAAGKKHTNLQSAGWYIEDYHALQGARVEEFNAEARRHLSASGVPVECTKGEWGLGQHELNVCYAEVLQMADRHAVYKQCLKELADRLGWSVTFMAKWAADGAGSSCHVHLSLWRDGENIFAGDHSLGPIKCSDEFRWFLGGWMARAAELMVCYAPNVNSYKRYQAGSWAPTRLAWSHDNRTAGFRVVGSGESLRIECRLPGADCNPYLTFAAALASGLDGIANKTEPPDMFDGDVYSARDVPHVPRTLHAATDIFEQSDFAREAFGENVVTHLVHFFRTEQQAYDRAVTDWERQRYFERI